METPNQFPSQAEQEPLDQAFADRLKANLEQEFDTLDHDQLATILVERIRRFAEFLDYPLEEIQETLHQAAQLPSHEEFVAVAYPLFEPLIRGKQRDPQRWQEIAQEAFVQSGKFETINQFIAYEIDGDSIHLHVPPNEVTSIKDKLRLIREGLAGIARILNDHPEIKYVVGTSWIAAQHQSLVERFGFVIEEVSEEERRDNFGNDPRGVKLATMSRDEFLKRYLP